MLRSNLALVHHLTVIAGVLVGVTDQMLQSLQLQRFDLITGLVLLFFELPESRQAAIAVFPVVKRENNVPVDGTVKVEHAFPSSAVSRVC